MKLIYIHQHFATTEGATGTRSYDVSKHMVRMGHQVTIICGLHDQGSLPVQPWYRLIKTHIIDGIKVVACNVPYSNKMSIPRRLWSLFGFALLASYAAIRERRPEIVFATSPPLETSIPGFLGSRLHRVPFVFEVRDLWPEDIVDAGRIKRGGLGHRLQSCLERFAYWAADRVFLVSRGFHDRLLERGFPDAFLRTILLGGDGTMFKVIHPDCDYMKSLGIENKFIAVYTGAHGVANGLIQVLDAAEILRNRGDIAFLFVGDGKERPNLLKQIADRGLKNCHMPGQVPKTRIPGILMGCHVGLQILTQVSRPRWVTPNKLFDYMFAGMPTIVNFAGTTAQLVEREQVGVASSPGCAKDLAARVAHYADNPATREATGRHAREVAWAKYDRASIATQLLNEFQQVITERRARKNK